MTTGEKIAAQYWSDCKHDALSDVVATYRGKLAKLIDDELEKNAQRAAERIDAITFGKEQDNSRPWIEQVRDIILNP